MRPVIRSLQLLLLSCALCVQATAAPLKGGDMVVDIGRGPVEVYVPASYDPSVPTPLVVLLHGYGSEPARADDIFQLTSRLDEYGFLLALPRGTEDPGGHIFWNATAACCNIMGTNVDDSGYLRALIEELEVVFSVDDRRIYVAGTSNGGFMSYRMANDHADKVAAIVSLGGASYTASEGFVPTGPVHVLEIHGTDDFVVAYNGGVLVAPYPSSVTSVERWATSNGCELVGDDSAPPLDLVIDDKGEETLVTRYESACNTGGSAELWTVVDGPHVPQISPNFSRHVLDYLYAHHKPEIGAAHCFGDGTTRPCPCENDSPRSGEGCLHSGNLGMRISGRGTASLSAGDLRMDVTNVPPKNAGVFFAGTAQNDPVNPLFDGLQCAGGDMRRFRSVFQSTGSSSDTDFMTQTPGYFVAGTTYQFQYWTRDANLGSSPCKWYANFSPAYAVTLVP
jgi:polyhydroxybutyrate depolymerase